MKSFFSFIHLSSRRDQNVTFSWRIGFIDNGKGTFIYVMSKVHKNYGDKIAKKCTSCLVYPDSVYALDSGGFGFT